MAFLLRFPSPRPVRGFTAAELKGIWRSVQRGYRRDRLRAALRRSSISLLVLAGAILLLLFSLK